MAESIHHYIQERVAPNAVDMRSEFRRVASENGIPYIPFPRGEYPFVLQGLDVQVSISGYFAQTTLTMTFFNPNSRPLEGNLELPMPDGASVCGYAIDIGGKLENGVIVSKQKARVVLESEIRKNIDPGIIEQVQGNIYRTRIYPLPAKGTRTVRISYSSRLEEQNGTGMYRLPLQYAQCVDRVSVQIDIDQPPSIPMLQFSEVSLHPKENGTRWSAQKSFRKGTIGEDIVLSLPQLPESHMIIEESDMGERFFFIRQKIEEEKHDVWAPDVLGIAWDASGSMFAQKQNLELLQQLLSRWPQTHILLQVFHNDTEPARRFSPEEHEQLIEYLEHMPYDGGTRLEKLILLDHGIDGWLFFSDGQSSLGGMPDIGQKPIFSIQPHTSSNSAFLRFLSKTTGGRHISLRQGIADSVQKIMMGPSSTRVAYNDGCADVHVERESNTIQIVGRCVHGNPHIEVCGNNTQASYNIGAQKSKKGTLVSRAWARKQSDLLGLEPEQNKEELLRLGRKHGIVTANTSLIVLETLNQHLEHGITPSVHRKKMFDTYITSKKKEKVSKEKIRKDHLDDIARLWKKRIDWWSKEYVYIPPKKQKSRVGRAPRSQPRSYPNMSSPSLSFERTTNFLAFRSSPAPSSEECFYEVSDHDMSDYEMSEEPKKVYDEDIFVDASMKVQAWNPDTPYLSLLRKTKQKDRYAVYLAQKTNYAQSPSFYLDCGDFFIKEGELAIGVRILSNLLELNIQDPPLMRMLAWRLQQAGNLDDAIEVFTKVLSIRDDEPQSHRDLALARGERWEQKGKEEDFHDAVKGLYHVVCHSWDRFPEIELIALMELNRLIHLGKKSNISIQEKIDSRLIKHLDLDVRISMSWDADLVDIDLHVDEPTGETVNYSHRDSAIGGHVSRDFQDGYGPEEYILRRGYKGTYKIRAHYYGSHQQGVAGPCTVIVHVYTNYGRKEEHRECLMLRLEKSGSDFTVGSITI